MRSPRELASRTIRRYQGDAERPVRGYAVVPGTYTAIVSVLGWWDVSAACGCPSGMGDTVLLGVATRKAHPRSPLMWVQHHRAVVGAAVAATAAGAIRLLRR